MQEINDIKESKALNLLIPEAIYQNNQIKKEFKQRIRLNKIFNDFENKASNELNYYINESSQRYNNLKNGHNLSNLLINSKPKNIKQAFKILEDPFYVDLNIEKEKEKMKIIKLKDLNKKMSPLLSKMKQPETINLKNLSTDFDVNVINRNNYDFEYNINPNNKDSIYKEYINNIIYNKKVNRNYWSKKPTFITENKKLVKFSKDLDLINKDKNYISKWFKREENLINKSFNNYKNFLEKEKEEKSITISSKDISSNIIKLPKLKLLNYKSQKNINKNNQNKDLNKNNIDYNYLLSFSDKSLYKHKNIFNSNEKEDETKNSNYIPNITEIYNNQSNIFEKYGNTVDIVVNSAKKELNKENDIDYKREKLEKIFGNDDIPTGQLYDEILKKKFETLKNERRHKAYKMIEKQNNLGRNKKQRLNIKIDNNVKLLDKVFKSIDMYNKKNKKI